VTSSLFYSVLSGCLKTDQQYIAKFHIFTVIKIHVMVWVITPSSDVIREDECSMALRNIGITTPENHDMQYQFFQPPL
jgi:hypothetical protein